MLIHFQIPETCCLYQKVQKVPKLTGETWNTFGVLIQFFKDFHCHLLSDNNDVDEKRAAAHFIFVNVICISNIPIRILLEKQTAMEFLTNFSPNY